MASLSQLEMILGPEASNELIAFRMPLINGVHWK